jgi:hypothetical protein
LAGHASNPSRIHFHIHINLTMFRNRRGPLA